MQNHMNTNKFISIVSALLIFAIIVAIFTAWNCCKRTLETSFNTGIEEVVLNRVVDGDTLVVLTAEGNEEYVRLIGIDAPESVHDDPSKNTEEGLLASDYLKGLLIEGQTLYLEKDKTERDKYNRLLRYVWLDPTGTTVETAMLNAHLVNDGYAQAKIYPPDTKYADTLSGLGDAAIERRCGVTYLWAGYRGE